MSDGGPRFDGVIAAIDAANARDPKTVEIDGRAVPAELLYGQRMSAALSTLAPDASELLHIAVRGQHIERWKSPRRSFRKTVETDCEFFRNLSSRHVWRTC